MITCGELSLLLKTSHEANAAIAAAMVINKSNKVNFCIKTEKQLLLFFKDIYLAFG